MVFKKSSYRKKSPALRRRTVSAYRKISRRPRRYAPKRTIIQTTVNRAVAKSMAGINEQKLLVLKTVRPNNAFAPLPINATMTTNNPTHYNAYCLGTTVPGNWSANMTFDPLNGVEAIEGTGPRGMRVGQYLYWKNTSMQISIEMLKQKPFPTPADSSNTPYRFRMIVFKEKRRVHSVNQVKSPGTSLFLAPTGDTFGSSVATGYTGANTTMTDMWQSMLARQNWEILKDDKFYLQPSTYGYDNAPFANQVAFCNSNYPTRKDISIRIPWSKKVKYSSPLPSDINYSVGIIIYAESMGRPDVPADTYQVNIQGCTSVLDN